MKGSGPDQFDNGEFKRFDFVDYLKTKFEPFLSISQETAEHEDLWEKMSHLRRLIDGGPEGPEESSNNWGLFDIAFYGIPRSLRLLSLSIYRDYKFRQGYPWLSRAVIGLCSFLYFLQRILGLTVTVLCSPLVLAVNFFYPKKNQEDNIPARKGLVTFDARGRDRRRLFFNPSTSIFLFLLTTVISLILQAYFPANLAQAAMALGIMQAVFASMAVLTLVTAVYLLATESPPTYSVVERSGHVVENYTHSGVRGYFYEMRAWWIQQNLMTFSTILVLAIAGLMVALIFTIGHFTYPSGFDFLEPFFDAISQAFTAISQGLSGLPGLDFLTTMPEGTAFVFSQVVGVLTFFMIAIFVPDTFRRIIQTIQGTPKAYKGEGLVDHGNFLRKVSNSSLEDERSSQKNLKEDREHPFFEERRCT